MGRPIKKIYFGPNTPGGSQLACEAWVNGDIQSRPGYIIKQNSSDSYWVQTAYGIGLCWLSDAVDQSGKMRIQVVAEGFPGISYAKKITDGEVYTWDGKDFPQWSAVNGQMVYGTVMQNGSWIASYGDLEADSEYAFGEGLSYDAAGNIISVGRVAGEFLVLKLSPTGNIIWQKTSDTARTAECVATDADNNIYVAYRSTLGGGCLKLNANGEPIWDCMLEDLDIPVDIALKSDNSVALGDRNGKLAWLNADGTVKLFIDPTGNSDGFPTWASVEFVGNNLFVASAYESDSLPNVGIHVMMLDDTGAKVWEHSYRCPTDSVTRWSTYADSDSDGNIYVQTRWSDDREKGWFAKFNSSGVLQWQRIVEDLSDYQPFSLRATPAGEIYSCGLNSSSGLSFIKLNTDGTLAWSKNMLTETYFDVWWSWGNKDIDVFQDRFIMTGYQGLDGKDEDYMFVTCLPTDGSGDGTYGIYTYQDVAMTVSTAAWATDAISYTIATPVTLSSSPSVTMTDLNYGIITTYLS